MKQNCILLLLILVTVYSFGQSTPKYPSRTYVFVHGAWANSLTFKSIDSTLTAQGNNVYRLSLTGMGERRHLASPNISLTTHIADIVNLIQVEDLHDIILVGHSYGGMVISGVVEQVPERVKQLIYVDAFVPNDGEGLLTSKIVASPTAVINNASIEANTKDGFIKMPLSFVKDAELQPLKTFTEPIRITNPAASKIASTYILMVVRGTAPEKADFYRAAERAKQRGWQVLYETGNHVALLYNTTYFTQLLEQIGSNKK